MSDLKTVAIVAIFGLIGAVASCSAQAEPPHLWVFGDSLSAMDESWPKYIDEANAAHVHNVAQGGLLLRKLQIPAWLRCNFASGTPTVKVAIWLGTNEAIFDLKSEPGRIALDAALATLSAKQCETYIILPPMPEPHQPLYSALIDIRQAIANTSYYGTVIEPPFDWGLTADGLHPNTELSQRLALSFALTMGLSPQ